jgi:hypothetical protein
MKRKIEFAKITELSVPHITRMMQEGTLSASAIEVLSLTLAAEHNLLEVMHVLLSTGRVNVNQSLNPYNEYPLDIAKKHNYEDMVALIISFNGQTSEEAASVSSSSELVGEVPESKHDD